MIYLDTSAILKLQRRETETDALINHLDAHAGQDLFTSALATVETARALIAAGEPTVASRAVRGADRIWVGEAAVIPAVAITAAVLDLARSMPPPVLRSLDAIHLATARLVGDDLDHVITYDRRMVAAAVAAGMPVATPV